MENILKITFLISFIFSSSCRSNPTPPTPISDINIQCQRMSSCYAMHNNLVTNPFIVDLVQKAQKSNDPIQCQTAVFEIEKIANTQCPF
ncbi:MAG: hypothetical protein KatS3mg068_1933 [Candidatus Sericytochromatia bacterium]|nr:MAG: hypothetical protein KatS3mg068_1933 [Candidatus Sericytochromatia bacterium]